MVVLLPLPCCIMHIMGKANTAYKLVNFAAAAACSAASHHLAARVGLARLLIEHLAGEAEICALVY
jgi:hypothetical protein